MKDLKILKETTSYIKTNITVDQDMTRGIEHTIFDSLITDQQTKGWEQIKDKDPMSFILFVMSIISLILYASTNMWAPYIAPYIERDSLKYLTQFVVVSGILQYLVYRFFREEPMKHELGKKLHDQFVSDVQASFEQYKSKLYREAIHDIFGLSLIDDDIKFRRNDYKLAVSTNLVAKYVSMLLESKKLPKIQGMLFHYDWKWNLRAPIKITEGAKLKSMKVVDGHIWFVTEGTPYVPHDSKRPELFQVQYHEEWYIH